MGALYRSADHRSHVKSLILAREGHADVTKDLTDSGRWEMIRLAGRLGHRFAKKDMIVMGGTRRYVAQSAFIVSEVLHVPLHISPELDPNGEVLKSCERALECIKKTDEDGRVIVVLAADWLAQMLAHKVSDKFCLKKRLRVPQRFTLGPGDAALIDMASPSMTVMANR